LIDILEKKYRHKIQLIFTSPPFPLNRKKKYGNLQGAQYLEWFSNLSIKFNKLLTKDGSIVIEIGNSWEPGNPIMSTLNVESLLAFKKRGKLKLCQQFICYNPARLPSPVQWVNIERIRVKDAFTHIWWLSQRERPKANNRNVLTPYSNSMKKLLNSRKYSAGKRPSEHNIGKKSFIKNNNGAIPPNVLTLANTRSTDRYQDYCKKNNFPLNPSRMNPKLPEFFINFLTDPGDIVFDPFAGSNTTGAMAEKLGRKWLSVEIEHSYIEGSYGWFDR
jgi:site-specific DNA-methyltransferase (cytosine-N4-specific)